MEVLILISQPDKPTASGALKLPSDGHERLAGLMVRVPGDDPEEALAKAMVQANEVGGEIVDITIRPDDWDTRELVTPHQGVKDIGDAFGHSRQYASQITQRGDFPAPTGILSATPYWNRIDVARWKDNAKQGRRRGRRRG